jgi:DNA-binding MarR family transcriptional regulator
LNIEVTRALMTSRELSANEKLTLYGLVRFPDRNDRELAAELGLKLSTVTAIRNRLGRSGHFRSVRIPFLERLGGELLIVTAARLNIMLPREELLRALREVLSGMDDAFYAVADGDHLLLFSMCRNYTDAWTDSEKGYQQLADRGVLAGKAARRQTVIFPLNQTRLLRFFDFSKALAQAFGIGRPDPDPPAIVKPEPPGPRRLSRIEKSVLLGLVRFPDLADNEVARKIGVTRQSVTKIRRRLESERLLAAARIPDLQRTGLEIMAMSHYEALPGATPAARRKGIEWPTKDMPAFFHVAGQREGIILGLAGSFTDFKRRQREASRAYLERGHFKDEPSLTLLSVPDLAVVKDFVFAPLVKRVLQVGGGK